MKTASDSSPLAFHPSLALDGREKDFQLGIDLLGKLTEGPVHLCTLKHADSCPAFDEATGVERQRFEGPYPAGQIEVQIHHVLPHKKGRQVWFVDGQDVAAIGELFRTGRYSVERVVAVGGAAHGIIDRLIVGPDHVLAVDFKTNRVVPAAPEDIPEGILRQMGAYETTLAAIYPECAVETAILWTREARLVTLPPGLALRAYGRLDAGQGGS